MKPSSILNYFAAAAATMAQARATPVVVPLMSRRVSGRSPAWWAERHENSVRRSVNGVLEPAHDPLMDWINGTDLQV